VRSSILLRSGARPLDKYSRLFSFRSDHTAVLLELKDIPAVPKHSPCALSSAVKFRQQKTLLSMFSTKAKEPSDGTSRKRDLDLSGEESAKKPKTSSLS